MKQKKLFLSVVIFYIMMNMCAQPGTIDPTFNPVDSGFWKGNAFNGIVMTSFVQQDGKFIMAGSFSKFNETKASRITRFNADGTVDPTFNNTGTGASNIQKVIAQADGKIFIVGTFQAYNNITRMGVARLNTDGSLDNTFDPGTGLNPITSFNQTMALQNDGKIIVGGYFKNFNGTAVGNIVRINPDGKQDTTFHAGTGFNSSVYSMVWQNDGKVIVTGSFTEYNGSNNTFIMRLNSDGSQDNTFNKGAGPNSQVNSILLQDDGKLMITGAFNSYNGYPRNGIARLNPDGSLDNTFNVTAGTFTGTLLATCKQTDGKIMVSEVLTTSGGNQQGHLVRLNEDGSVDNGFYILAVDNNIRAFFPQSDGKIIVGGTFTKCNGILRNYIARLYPDGTLDNNVFNLVGKGVNGNLWTSAIQADGKILIGGFFVSYNGIERGNVARLNTDGSLDTTFHTGTGTDDWVESIAIQKDGKILLGGWFTEYKGVPQAGLARLNTDGSLDTTLKADPGFSPFVEHVSVQADGKIIASGDFTTYNGVKVNNIIRFQANGSVDTTFKPATGGDGLIWTNLVQPDGKIILAGVFNINNGTNVTSNITRLNVDGSIDTSFHSGSGTDNIIYALGLQKDGKIIIGGVFETYNGWPVSRIARLNSNGTLDNAFNSGTGINAGSSVGAIAIQDNGKIIVGGTYTSFNGIAANSLVRLNSDGSLDNVFKNTSGATNKGIWTTNIQHDGKIIIGGNFTDYDGTGRNNVARVIGDNLVNIDENTEDNVMIIYPNPSNGEFTIEVERTGEILIMDDLGRLVLEKKLHLNRELINLTNMNDGIYFLRINTGQEQITKKIIISK